MLKKSILIPLFIFSAFVIEAQQLPQVKIETKYGWVLIEADTLSAPVTASNFLNHIKKGTYKNAVFYRVVRNDNQPNNNVKIEVVQGGLFSGEEIGKIQPILHETTRKTGIKHGNGTISMARMEPGTASTEFFICIGDQPELDFGGKRNPDGQGFAAFGKVVSGLEVIRKIQEQKDTSQYLVEPVRILKIWIK